MRIRGFPFDEDVREFIESHERIFVIEQNRDGQLRSLLAIELGVPPGDMIPILDYGGMPLTARVVVEAVTAAREEVPA
jgi:2-oxoglutarate ferredoxin oxidoreductase subunit alpha